MILGRGPTHFTRGIQWYLHHMHPTFHERAGVQLMCDLIMHAWLPETKVNTTKVGTHVHGTYDHGSGTIVMSTTKGLGSEFLGFEF